MSYGIFASGTGDYSTGHRRNFTDEGDIYELAEAIGEVAERGNIELGGQSDAHRLGTDAMGTLHSVHILQNAVAFLLMRTSRTHVFIAAHHNTDFYGDVRDVIKVFDMPWSRHRELSLEGNSQTQATRDLIRALRGCRLNRWGIMLGVAEIVSDFASHQSQGDARLLRDVSV